MDIQTIAATVTSFLTPALPYLVKAGEKGSEIIGEKLGAGVWETAKAIWQKLSPNPLVQSAAQEVADAPDDPDAQEILRLRLKKSPHLLKRLKNHRLWYSQHPLT